MTFEQLVKKISPTIKRIAYKLKGHNAFFSEEDLYQEALVHLWRSFNAGKLLDKTDSYILQGCYFHLKNHLRCLKDRIRAFSLNSVITINDEDDSCGDLELADENSRHYLEDLNTRLLAETICNNGLTPREKKILFFYAQGLTTRQIGSRLGISHVRVIKLTRKIKEKCYAYTDPQT
jgi:RNA polymerase sigma factor (sigma-70 family)